MLRSIVVRGGKADPKKQIPSFSQEEEKWYSREREIRGFQTLSLMERNMQ